MGRVTAFEGRLHLRRARELERGRVVDRRAERAVAIRYSGPRVEGTRREAAGRGSVRGAHAHVPPLAATPAVGGDNTQNCGWRP